MIIQIQNGEIISTYLRERIYSLRILKCNFLVRLPLHSSFNYKGILFHLKLPFPQIYPDTTFFFAYFF